METNKTHVCPWWLGYFLINPLRKIGQNPQKILSPYVKAGMQVLDYGCAMGYFSIPMAEMTGSTGKVICVDIQQQMLNKLVKRARNANVLDIIRPVLLGKNGNLSEFVNQVDLILLFAVAHEVPDKKILFRELYATLKPAGKLVFAEPSGHVTPSDFENSVTIAGAAGFKRAETLTIYRSHAIILQKL